MTINGSELKELIALRQRVAALEHTLTERDRTIVHLEETLQEQITQTHRAVGASVSPTIAAMRMDWQLHLFKLIADFAPDAIGIANTEGVMIYANAAYGLLTGYGDALVGMKLKHLFAHEDRPDFIVSMEHIKQYGRWKGILTYLRQDGSKVQAESTRFLIRDTQGQPQAFVAIVRDLSEQQRQAAERATLQQQVIMAQQAALRELSTPLIPLSDQIVIMPLVGSIDTTRAQQVMEVLLNGIASTRAEVAILDITGVSVMDAAVGSALVQTAQAVQLLGAHVVLTGIGPAMAQTLVSLGVDLGSLVTRSTLQAGIAYAMRRTS